MAATLRAETARRTGPSSPARVPTFSSPGTHTASTPSTTQGMIDALSGANRDAFVALERTFAQYGLESLAPKIFSYIQNGYSPDTIALLLQDTPEYKTRFAGNDLRRKAGLAVLSPQDYLSTEASYRQILSSAGLPASFYDTPADFANWIGGDVSPTEIQNRVQLATAATTAADPYLKQQLQAFYGVDPGQITAYFLDQSKALPLLQKQEQAAAFGAEAARRGLLTDANRMMDYVNQGLSQSQASQGFQQIADELPNLQALATRFGVTFGQADEEQAIFGTGAAGVNTRQNLINNERSLFASNSGSAASGLSAGYRAT